MISPERDSPAPAVTAARILGIRMFQMIRIWEALPFFIKASKHSAIVIWDDPINNPRNARRSTLISNMIMIQIFLRFFGERADVLFMPSVTVFMYKY